MIQKKTAIIGLAIMFLLTGTAAYGGGKDSLVSHYWKRHEDGVKGVLAVWERGGTDREYAGPMRDIISAETNLITFGISPSEKRFVSSLFNRDGSRRPSKDAYGIFLNRFKKQSHWEPSHENIWHEKVFTISYRGTGHTFTINTD